MEYALMLAEDGQILFATEQKDAQDGAVMVQALPDGNLTDYQYIDGEYIYHPLPKPEAPEPEAPGTGVSEDVVWDAMAAAYNEGVQSA